MGKTMKCYLLNTYILMIIISISICSDSSKINKDKLKLDIKNFLELQSKTNLENKSNAKALLESQIKSQSQIKSKTNTKANSLSLTENKRKINFKDFFIKNKNENSYENENENENKEENFFQKNEIESENPSYLLNEERNMFMDYDSTKLNSPEREINTELENEISEDFIKDFKNDEIDNIFKINQKEKKKGPKVLINSPIKAIERRMKIFIENKNSFLNKLRENLKNKKTKSPKKLKHLVNLEKKVNKYSKCFLKTGILFELKGIKFNNKSFTYEAHMKTTYTELSKDSIILKDKITNEKDLSKKEFIYKLLNLKKILRISQEKKLQKYGCFDLIYKKDEKKKNRK